VRRAGLRRVPERAQAGRDRGAACQPRADRAGPARRPAPAEPAPAKDDRADLGAARPRAGRDRVVRGRGRPRRGGQRGWAAQARGAPGRTPAAPPPPSGGAGLGRPPVGTAPGRREPNLNGSASFAARSSARVGAGASFSYLPSLSLDLMKIAVVGTGYVGLVSGTCFAEMGNDVTCVDIDRAKVAKLQGGTVTIYEPGLEVYFERGLREGRLHFTTELAEALEEAEVVFLALPTPPAEDGSADLQYVLGVADDVGRLLAAHPDWGYKVLVDKSTVPVGTARRVIAAVEAHGLKAGEHFDVVSNPEFLREGMAVEDFMKPERVVVGASTQRAADLMTRLYEPFVRSGNPILVMDEESAEMTKYAANALLATKITFMNEIANLCERVGADVDKVRRGIGTDSRIGPKFLYAGIGFGGSCFPKDVQ